MSPQAFNKVVVTNVIGKLFKESHILIIQIYQIVQFCMFFFCNAVADKTSGEKEYTAGISHFSVIFFQRLSHIKKLKGYRISQQKVSQHKNKRLPKWAVTISPSLQISFRMKLKTP
jgi:hypothetical protein